MNMEINPSEYKILIVDDVMSNVFIVESAFDKREIRNCYCE